jgi:predicted 3-demethylubiquinone-9 3-methyltransferase (glyoxalase superfamily)
MRRKPLSWETPAHSRIPADIIHKRLIDNYGFAWICTEVSGKFPVSFQLNSHGLNKIMVDCNLEKLFSS